MVVDYLLNLTDFSKLVRRTRKPVKGGGFGMSKSLVSVLLVHSTAVNVEYWFRITITFVHGLELALDARSTFL